MDDLIRRSDLERDIREYADRKHANGEDIVHVNGILKSISIVKSAPSVDAEPVRRGRWVLDCFVTQSFEGEYDEEFYLICSKCGRKVYDINQSLALRGDANLFSKQYPYCHCGAKMDGGADHG